MQSSKKRILAAVISAGMLLPVSGCKKSGNSSKSKGYSYTSGQEIKETDPYFQAEIKKIELPKKEGFTIDYESIENCTLMGGVAMVAYSQGYVLPEGKRIEDMSFEEGAQYYVQGTALFDADGEMISEFSDSAHNVITVVSGQDNDFYLLYGEFDPVLQRMAFRINVLTSEGETVKTIALSTVPYSDDSYSAKLQILKDGSIGMFTKDGLYVMDQEGNEICKVSDPGRTLETAVISQDGKDYVISGIYDINEDMDIQIKEVDLKTGSLGKAIDGNYLAAYTQPVITDSGIYVSGTEGCKKVDLKTGELETVFNWNDTDVSLQMISTAQVVPLNDNEFMASASLYTGKGVGCNLIHLKRADKNPHAGQKVLIIGGTGAEYSESMSAFIAEYNADPDSPCHIVYRDYADGVAPNEGYAGTEQKLYLDILSGEGPDILINASNSAAFQSEETVVDLNSYMNGADGIDRSEYFENIFPIFEKDGKLFHIPVRVELYGFQANEELLDKRFGWTYDEFEKAGQSLPEGVSFMEGTKYDELLLNLIGPKMKDFIDFSKKSVNFENEDMKRLLQLSKKYGVKEIPADEGMDLTYLGDGMYSADGDDRTMVKYQAGLLAMKNDSVYNLREYCHAKDAMDKKIFFVGFPSEEGKGMSVYCMLSLAISASSQFKDEAWDFIRSYLGYEMEETNIELGLPVNRALFESSCHKEMEAENAAYENAIKSMPLEHLRGVICKISESDIDELRELMEHADGTEITIAAISDVLKEEAAAYFAGDRTEEEVLKNIQNRAGNIIKEMS